MEKSKKILKGKDKEIDSNVVTKRASIDNNTLTEINEKYPTVTVKGVAYDLGLTYITLEKDYLDEPSVRKIIKDYGAEIIAVICFFRMKMCKPYGWYCSVDDDSLDTLIEDCAYTLKLGEERVRELYSALVERGIFYVISDDTGNTLPIRSSYIILRFLITTVCATVSERQNKEHSKRAKSYKIL